MYILFPVAFWELMLFAVVKRKTTRHLPLSKKGNTKLPFPEYPYPAINLK